VGEEALVSVTRCHPKRRRVDATGLGRRSRVLPWEICARAAKGRSSPSKVWAESCRSQQRAERLSQQPEAQTSNHEPMPKSR
jgi:hypothetical protein